MQCCKPNLQAGRLLATPALTPAVIAQHHHTIPKAYPAFSNKYRQTHSSYLPITSRTLPSASLLSRARSISRFTPASASVVLRATVQQEQHTAEQQRSKQTSNGSDDYSEEADADFIQALNEVSSRAMRVMVDRDEDAAFDLGLELDDMRIQVAEEGMASAASFFRVLQGMLSHTVLVSEARKLPPTGLYPRAIDRILNTIQGSEWKLYEEGKSELSDGTQQPKFSTWEDVLGGKKGGEGGASSSSSAGGQKPQAMGRPGAPLERAYYDTLGVAVTASTQEIKQAYRKAALKVHPDVSDAPDAEAQFLALAQAYDILSSEASRRLYDTYGAAGMQGLSGSTAGSGNAREAWDEFKPYKRENKFTQARDASRDSSSSGSSMDGGPGAASSALPKPGDVVEYPLSEVVQQELKDGRSHGVALLVGRNMDRPDAGRLPPQLLDLCEVEPLRQDAPGSSRWVADELASGAYPRLGELKVLPVSAFDSRFDVWTVEGELSPGCGGPELPEEIML